METCIKKQEIQNIKSSIFILNMEKHSSRQGGQCVPSSIIVNCIQKNKVDEQCHPSWPLALKLFPPFQNIYTSKSYVSSFSRNSRTKSQSSLSVALNLHNWKSNQFGKKNISLTKVHVWTLYIIRWQHFCNIDGFRKWGCNRCFSHLPSAKQHAWTEFFLISLSLQK